MNQISKPAKPSTIWWLLAGDNLCGDILLSELFGVDTISCLSEIANKIYWVNNEVDEDDYRHVENLTIISPDEVNNYTYDLILVNNIKKNDYSHYMNMSKQLKESGVICFCHKYAAGAKSKYLRIIDKIFVNYYVTKYRLESMYGLYSPTILPTMIYGSTVYESQLTGNYVSNKNNFLFKEKLKKLLYYVFPSVLLSSGAILLYKKSKTSPKNNLFDKLKTEYNSKNENAIFIPQKVLYKYRKLLINFSRSNSNSIAVICADDVSKKQRETELATIEYLNKHNVIPELLPGVDGELYVYGYSVFFMGEINGFTIDVNTPILRKATNVAYDSLIELTDRTIRKDDTVSFLNKINGYINNLDIRYPEFSSSHKRIADSLSDIINKITMTAVCMHGDYKIENVVINKRSKYYVSGIIDWELSEINGTPFVDLLYLISYNKLISNGQDFFYSFIDIMYSELEIHESALIADYMKRYKFNSYQYKLCLIVFFLHHFSMRYHLDISKPDNNASYESSLVKIEQLINNINNKEI